MNDNIKEFILNEENKPSIEVLQWAAINGIASVVYSDFIASIVQKTTPVRKVLVPSIKDLEYMLDPRGSLLRDMPKYLLAYLNDYFMESKLLDRPEMSIFAADKLDMLYSVFDEYIIPNISKQIPKTITKKFGLDDEKQQLIREDRSIEMFKKYPIDDKMKEYIALQIALQFLTLKPDIKKTITDVDSNTNIKLLMEKDIALSINHSTAICPIIINEKSFMYDVNNLIMFVTGTTVCDDSLSINTMPFNTVQLIQFHFND